MPIKPKELAAARLRLLARRRELLAHYHNMNDLAEEEQVPEIELIDSANEQWDLQILSAMSETDAHALTNVVAALQRVDARRYGECTSCGTQIERRRLLAIPEAALCIECAQLAERPRTATAIG